MFFLLETRKNNFRLVLTFHFLVQPFLCAKELNFLLQLFLQLYEFLMLFPSSLHVELDTGPFAFILFLHFYFSEFVLALLYFSLFSGVFLNVFLVPSVEFCFFGHDFPDFLFVVFLGEYFLDAYMK